MEGVHQRGDRHDCEDALLDAVDTLGDLLAAGGLQHVDRGMSPLPPSDTFTAEAGNNIRPQPVAYERPPGPLEVSGVAP